MKHRIFVGAVFAGALVLAFHAAGQGAAQRAIQLPDILAWKHIQTPLVSNDGQWFAYRLAPNEGDAELVVRNLKDGSERRYPIGEQPRPDPNAGPQQRQAPTPPQQSPNIAFSADSRWIAVLAFPGAQESKMMKGQTGAQQTKVVLLELATGNRMDFPRTRRFAFSGEKSHIIALQRYPAMAGGAAMPQGALSQGAMPQGALPQVAVRRVAVPQSAGQGQAPAGAQGGPPSSDLVLRNLATGDALNIGNVSEFAFDKQGNWLAWTISAEGRIGNGIVLRNLVTGMEIPLESGPSIYRALNWTEKGDALVALRGMNARRWQGQVFALIAFKGFSPTSAPAKIVYEPMRDQSFPAGMAISPSRMPAWMDDLSAISFGIHELTPRKMGAGNPAGPQSPGDEPDAAMPMGMPGPAAEDDSAPSLVLWHWKDARLQSMQQVQENADRNFAYLAEYRPAEQKFIRLADEQVRRVNVTPEHKYAVGIDVRDYELQGSLSGQRFEDIYAIDLKTGQRKLALKKAHWVMSDSPDGTHVLYYNDGAFYTYDLASGQSYNITRQVPAVFYDTEDDHNVVKPPTKIIGWARDSSAVLLTDNWDIWKVPVHGGEGVNLTGNGKKDNIRYRTIFQFDREEKGIDLAEPVYVGAYGELTKKGGIGRIEPGKPGIRMLHWDDANYKELLKAKKADVYLYTRETMQEYPDFYVAGSSLEGKKVTDVNPQQKNFLWSSGVKIVDYTSDKGDKLQAALYLPAGYQAGKSYPTIVFIYEKLTERANVYPMPNFNGFNQAAYTSNGYAVLMPDIKYRVNDPGMSAVWCVLPALKAAVKTGVVDPKRVGLTGHSWGGYQTAFLVTQTNAFHAALAGSPLTDMVSMYSLIYGNTGGSNQPAFEAAQGRFKGGYLDNLEAYTRNSPVYHAKNVETPLIVMSNDKDGAVDWTQGIEYYNTLRRLGKPVILLEYKGENHVLRKPANMKDYTLRMKEFFDHYLMDKPAPNWLAEGVPLLKMKDQLEEEEKALGGEGQDAGTPPRRSGPFVRRAPMQ